VLLANITGSEYPSSTSLHIVCGNDIASVIKIHNILEETGIGVVPYIDKDSLGCDLCFSARFPVLDNNGLHGVLAPDLPNLATPEEIDLLVVKGPVLDGLGRSQIVTAMNNCHPVGELGQEDCLLDSGISTTDYNDIPPPEEGSIAGGAVRYSLACEPLFARNP